MENQTLILSAIILILCLVLFSLISELKENLKTKTTLNSIIEELKKELDQMYSEIKALRESVLHEKLSKAGMKGNYIQKLNSVNAKLDFANKTVYTLMCENKELIAEIQNMKRVDD